MRRWMAITSIAVLFFSLVAGWAIGSMSGTEDGLPPVTIDTDALTPQATTPAEATLEPTSTSVVTEPAAESQSGNQEGDLATPNQSTLVTPLDSVEDEEPGT